MFREQVRGHLRFLADHKGMKEAERARLLFLAGLHLRGLVLPERATGDVSERSRVAVVRVGRVASTIGAVTAGQDGRSFRAPAFMRVKPNPPSAAGELAERQHAPAVVCEVGWVNGLGAIRSLGRAGIPVVAVDHRDFAIGFRSSYAFPVTAPDPVADEAGFIEAMRELGDALDRPAPVFPTHDEHLNSLARHRDELGERFRYPFPSWDVLEPLQSKRHQVEVAESLGSRRAEDAPPAVARRVPRRRARDRLPRAGQAVRQHPVQADLPPPGLRLRAAGRPRRGLREGGAVRADAPGVHPRRRRLPLDAGSRDRRGRGGAGDVLGPKAQADAREHGQRARRGSFVGRRGRRLGARPPEGAAVLRRRAGRVEAGSARREAQADRGQSAPLAVARADGRVRRRRHARGLLGPGGRPPSCRRPRRAVTSAGRSA